MEKIKRIDSVPLKTCTGCYTCQNICPKNSIFLKENEKGFVYPQINYNTCINCGLCYITCPPINYSLKNEVVPDAYSLNASKEICLKSSSGGVFSVLATYMLSLEKGVVYGAKSNGLEHVWHSSIENIDDLDSLRRSKYFQSDIGYIYRDIKSKLRSHHHILFVGTPCQIAGLNNFLGKTYENLITCDLVCHGVPSKMVFRRFIQELEREKKKKVKKYYRDSSQWAPVIFTTEYEDGTIETKSFDIDLFNLLFHSNLIQRDSCKNCKFCKIPRVGDFTLGDDWIFYGRNITNKEKLKYGRSYILLNNNKSKNIFNKIQYIFEDIEKVPYIGGMHITIPPQRNILSSLFYKEIKKKEIIKTIHKYTTHKPLYFKIILKIFSIYQKIKKIFKPNIFKIFHCKQLSNQENEN